MKNICKFVSLCLTAVMLLSMLALVACKKNNENNNDTGKDIANYQSNGTNNLGQVYYNKNLFYNNSVIQGGPDPQVLDNTERDGYYYLFITAGILRSTNLTDWEEAGPLFVPETDELKKVLKENVWAPETVYDEDLGKYVMFFSSTAETDTSYAAGKGIVSGRGYCVMHVALSDKPEGPYTLVDFSDANSCGEDNVHTYNTVGGTKLTDEQVTSNEYAYVKEGDTYYRAAFPHYFTKYLLFNPEAIYKFLQTYGDITANSRNGKYPQDTIDPHPFVDPKTGNKYLFCTLGQTGNAMMVIRMINWLQPDFSEARIVTAHDYYTVNDWLAGKNKGVEYEESRINEGPHVLYHTDKNGKSLYYLTYSINSYEQSNYSVAIAIADNVLGPYRKLRAEEGALLLSSRTTESTTVSGAGHHSFISKGGQDFIVYHRHNDYTEGGGARYTAIDEYKWITVKDKDGNDLDIPYTNGPTDSVQPLPEAFSEYRNVVKDAKVKASDGEVDADAVHDGLLSVHKTANETFMSYVKEAEITKKTTFTFTFDKPLTARAVMVYNSAFEQSTFRKVDLVELVGTDDKVKTIHNVEFDSRNMDFAGENADELMYVKSGAAAITEFYDTLVKEVRVTLSVPEGQEYVGISEIRILGKDGNPTYTGDGETEYKFSNPTGVIPALDGGVTIDGEFAEAQWANARWLKGEDRLSSTQYAEIEFTTWYGDKGVYFGMKVVEHGSRIYHNPKRDSYMNSCVEMYMGPADAPRESNKIFEVDFSCIGTVKSKLNLNGWTSFAKEKKIMPYSAVKPLGGEVNTPECYGYQIETIFPYEFLQAAGYDIGDKDNLVLGINPVHIWSFTYDGTDLNKDRSWSNWGEKLIGAEWNTPSTWFTFGKNGLIAYDVNTTVNGNGKVKVDVNGGLGVVFAGGTAKIVIKTINGAELQSLTVNGSAIDLTTLIKEGGSYTLNISNVNADIDMVINTK